MTGAEGTQINALTAAVGELKGAVDAMARQWAMQENHASSGRQIVHQKIDSLTREVGNISADVRYVTQDVAELKNDIEGTVTPTIEAYKAGVSRKEGVAWAVRIFWTIVVAIAGGIGFTVHEALFYFKHSPVPINIPGIH